MNRFTRRELFLFIILSDVLLVFGLIGYWVYDTNQTLEISETFAAADGAPGEIVTVQGYDLHVQTLGSAENPPLLLIHGFSVEGGMYWDEFASQLSEQYYVIAPDLLGFGHSERVIEPVDAYSHAGQASLMADLLSELGLEQVDVLGASYGGGVATQLALDHPGKVDQLVLIAPQVFELGGGIFQTLVSLPFGLGRALTWTAQGAGPRSESLATLGCDSGDYCPDAGELEERMRLAEIQGTTDALIAFSTTPQDARIPADLSQVSNDTLLIWGTEDGTFPYDEFSQRTLDAYPSATLETMQGLGHNPYKQEPAETAQLVKDFLK